MYEQAPTIKYTGNDNYHLLRAHYVLSIVPGVLHVVTHIILTKPHETGSAAIPTYRWGTWSTEGLSDLPDYIAKR